MQGMDLKIMRIRRGLRAWDVAREAAIHPSKLSLIENGRIEAPPHLAERIVYMSLPEASPENELLELVEAEGFDPFRTVRPVVTELSPGAMTLTVVVSPPLEAGDSIKYRIVEKGPPGLYAVTGLEDRKLSFDYFAWDINTPTRRLEMRVMLPAGFQPLTAGSDAWYALGQTRSRHAQEYERMRKLLEQRQEGAYLALVATIPYPLLGLTYAIIWTPPKAERGS
jgi:hypothetical protein